MAKANTIYGISTAVFGENPYRVSRAVLRGKDKHNISIIHEAKDTFGPETGKTITDMMKEAMGLVKDVCGKNSKVKNPSLIPVVFGTPIAFQAEGLVRDLMTDFSPLLSLHPELQKIDSAEYEQFRNSDPKRASNFWKMAFAICTQELLTSVAGAQIQSEARDFETAQTDVLSVDEIDASVTNAIRKEVRQEFHALLQMVLGGATHAKPFLEAYVRQIALTHATPYILRMPFGHRFIANAAKPELNVDGDVTNFIFNNLDLREVYTREFMRLVQSDHNVVFKCSMDPKSPPFSDVAATYMADLMDKLYGTSPSAILIKQRKKR